VLEAIAAVTGETDPVEAIKWLQEKLEIEENGIYGELTEKTVKEKQTELKLTEQDGIADLELVAYLFA